MSNPSGPDQPDEATDVAADDVAATDEATQADPEPDHEPATEILLSPEAQAELPQPEEDKPAERRFTAPSGFDAGSTQKIDTPAEPATEVMSVPDAPAGMAAGTAATEPMSQQKVVAPQHIPARGETTKPLPRKRRSWGWVIALVLVIAALAAVAILGTLLLTRGSTPKASEEDKVRSTIQNFDIAVQRGDLATLRSITCGTTRDSYVNYDDRAWTDTHARVAAAKQYPVVASIDQVVVNGDHAEANVTTFMAYAPQTRSTRSFDLQFRDDQWKICQAPNG
ncbi:Rv0361 family membrane protein [Mycobacterium sp. MMS18-G62]